MSNRRFFVAWRKNQDDANAIARRKRENGLSAIVEPENNGYSVYIVYNF